MKKGLLIIVASMSVGLTQTMNNHFISLPDAYTIRKHLNKAGFSDFILATDIHRDLGGRTISKQGIIDIVNSEADWAQRTLALILGKVSKEEREEMVQVIVKLDLNNQAKL